MCHMLKIVTEFDSWRVYVNNMKNINIYTVYMCVCVCVCVCVYNLLWSNLLLLIH